MSERKGKDKGLSEFEKLEKEFEQVLNELIGDENLQKFRGEYEKLHAALVLSHDSERKLMEKVRQLNAEIQVNANKVAAALQMSQEDQSTIAILKKEVDKAWKMVEIGREKELIARDTIQSLKQEIDKLTILVEKGAGLPQDAKQLEAREEVDEPAGKSEEETETEEERARQEAERKAEDEYQQSLLYQTELELRSKGAELQRERTRYKKLEKVLAASENALEKEKAELEEARKQLEAMKASLTRLQDGNNDLILSMDNVKKENDILNVKLQRALMEVQKQSSNADELTREKVSLGQRIREMEENAAKMTEDIKKLMKIKERLSQKVHALTEARNQLKKEKLTMQNELGASLKDLEMTKKVLEVANSRIITLTREKDNAMKLYGKQVKSMAKQTDLLHLQERSNQTLSGEIIGFQRESEKQRRIITQMELERDRYILDNDELTQRLMKCMEEVQLRDMQILDSKKQVEELETRLKLQQKMYEAIHADRNNYSFKLVETMDEMAVMRNKVHVLEHQCQQLKEEVANTEALVTKEHAERSRVEKDRDAAYAEVQALKANVRAANEAIQELKMLEGKLMNIIATTDKTCRQQKRELGKILNERDVLGSQLVRRNDEMSLMYEKTRLLTTLMNKGYVAYHQRMEDMRLLRLEVKRLRNDKRCLEKTVRNVHDYRQELYQCHRDLLRERARCAALETELSHPRQIHRWRGLEITDPSRFELLQKVQMLQKRLISRTEEVVEVEQVLQEKDRLYVKLRAVLERQPGPEIIEQLAVYQRVLRNKNKQLKQLTAELNMFETETKLQKHDMNKMEKEVTDLKKKYYKERKHRQEALDRKIFGLRRAAQPRQQFTGGGFKVSV